MARNVAFASRLQRFVRIDGRLVAVRAIVEKPRDDEAAPLAPLVSAQTQPREFSKVAEYADVQRRRDTLHPKPIDRLI